MIIAEPMSILISKYAGRHNSAAYKRIVYFSVAAILMLSLPQIALLFLFPRQIASSSHKLLAKDPSALTLAAQNHNWGMLATVYFAMTDLLHYRSRRYSLIEIYNTTAYVCFIWQWIDWSSF